jgi:hypothetical protein
MSLSPQCVARSHRSSALIIPACQRVLVDSGLSRLCSYATPAVPGVGVGRHAKTTLVEAVDGPDSIHAHLVREKCRSSGRKLSSSLIIRLPFPSG